MKRSFIFTKLIKDKILPCGCKIQPSGFNNIDIRKDGIGKAIEKSGY